MARPNLVLFLTDDHGRWALGCEGNPEVRSPSIDHLAATGVRCSHAFTPTPVCSPARACVMTGLIASRHGIHDWLQEQQPEVGERDWLAGLRTLPQWLEGVGYRCMLSGKWHLGRSEHPQRGFHDTFAIGQPQGGHAGRQRYSRQGVVEYRTGFKTEVVTQEAVRLLRQRRGEEPFFLCVGYIGTHTPWAGHPERLVEAYRRRALTTFADHPPEHADGGRAPGGLTQQEALAQYYAAVTHIDEGVGRVLDELQSQGLRDRTMVVYAADHGLALGQHGVWGKGNATKPKNLYEASIRVPLVYNHPGSLPEGRVVDSLVDHCDLFCTLLDTAGVQGWRDDPQYPGRSYLPQLRGEPQTWEDLYFGEYGPLRCVRSRTHKLVRRYGHAPDELYDLAADPGETRNVLEEPGSAPVTATLTTRLDEFFSRHEDPERSGLRFDPDSRGVTAEHVRRLSQGQS